jgi:hypothetical protein
MKNQIFLVRAWKRAFFWKNPPSSHANTTQEKLFFFHSYAAHRQRVSTASRDGCAVPNLTGQRMFPPFCLRIAIRLPALEPDAERQDPATTKKKKKKKKKNRFFPVGNV